MSSPSPPRAGSVLARPALRRWVAARLLSGAGSTMMRAVFLWQLYELTKSTTMLGLLGLFLFLPGPAASLLGGLVADSFDRKRVIVAAQFVGLAAALGLSQRTMAGESNPYVLMACVILGSASFAFESPARQALLPSLVPKEEFPRAVTVMGTAQSLAMMTGPALGGVMLAYAGILQAYLTSAGMFLVSIVLVWGIDAPFVAPKKRAISIAGLMEGLRFVKGERALLGAMTLDLFAVIFGGATALLPVFASDILHVGPKRYGLLASSLELGALAASIALMMLPPIRRLGRAVVLGVIGYGAATLLFGLSNIFWLSVALYAVVGVFDQISVVSRITLVQLATPDELRGRVSSVNILFIGASNQLAVAEAGLLASLTSPVFSVVFGGLMVFVVTALVVWRFRPLLTFEDRPA